MSVIKISAIITAYIPSISDFRIAILQEVAKSLKYSGANHILIITNGIDISAAASGVGDICGNVPSQYIGENIGHIAGEVALVRAAASAAIVAGSDWIVRVPGDCLHTEPDWAKNWYLAAKGRMAAVLGGYDGWAQTKVLSAYAPLLLSTFGDTPLSETEHSWIPHIKDKFPSGFDSITFVPLQWVKGQEYLYVIPSDLKLNFIHAHNVNSLKRPATPTKMCPKASPPAQHTMVKCRLEIVSATYGTSTQSGDVTDKIRKLVKDNTVNATACNAVLGDTAKFHKKFLNVKFVHNGKSCEVTIPEDGKLVLP
jgi:hypothetical protein